MIDRSDTTDYRLRHGRQHMTGGGDAVWSLDPAELCARMEENHAQLAQREREALREEIFNTLLEYLFADGPEPWNISARARAYLYAVIDHHPDPTTQQPLITTLSQLPHTGDDDYWVTAQKITDELKNYADRFREIRETLSGTAPLSTWFAALRAEPDTHTVWDSHHHLAQILTSQGPRPRQITGVIYCLAKTLKPHLIASMSLHTIAILSGDEGGRATPQARCKRIYTLLLQQAGARATRYHHQKTAAHAERCRAAQIGNTNRAKNHHPTPKNKRK